MLRNVCLLLVSLFASHVWAADKPSPEIQRIAAVLQQQIDAWNDGNIDRFMETYWKSEQLSFSSGGQTTRGWQATLERYRKRYPDRGHMGRLTFSEQEITLLGDTAAMVLGRWHLDRDGGPLEGNFTLIMRKLDDHWRIVHDHTSKSE